MPSASKYIVDINKIRKPNNVGTGGIFVGLGGSNRESLYAVRGTGSGNVVIYDKVKYDLSVDNISNQEPNSHSVTFTYSSKRTHGNNAVDTLSITPKTYTIEANTSTASTKTTIVEVKQTLADGATLTGNTVNVTITQIPDYATSISLSISPKSTIPASGGSISSGLTNFTYSVKANHKSGNNNVDVTSLASITANVTGVTAPSKGVTASTETTAGNITFTATYSGLTSQVIVPIKQNENKVESYAAPTYTLSPGNTVLPASGGSVTGSISTPQQVRTWSSTATDTYSPTYTSTWTAQTISCNSRGTTTGDQTTLGTTQITVTANGKSTTKSYTVYQQANAVTNSDYNASNIDYWASCSIGDGMTAADGSASVSASAGHTHKYYYLYTSTSTSGPYYTYPGDTVTTAMVANGNNRFSYNTSTKVITHSSMGTTATTDTVTIRATNAANTSATGDASKSIVNQVTNDNYSPYSYYASCSIGDGLTAGGGSATVTASAGHYSYYLYTSGSYDGGGHHHSDGVTTAMVGNGNNRFSYSNGTITHSSMGTTATTDTVTIRATNSTNGSYSDASKSIVNQVTNDNYSPYSYSASVSVGNGISAAGGSATVTASAGHYSYYLYTSNSYDGGGHWHSDGVSTEMTENGNNRFSYNANTLALSHSSMGTDVTTDYVTIKATNTTNTSATASTRPGWSNAITNYDYNASNDTWTASASIGNGISAGGGSATVSHSASHRHVYYYLYTSQSTSGPYTSTVGDSSTIAITSNGNNRFSLNGDTLSHSSMGTNVTTDTVVIKVTNSSNTSCTGSTSGSWSNAVTSTTWGDITGTPTGSCSDIPAGGGTVTATTTTPQTLAQNYKYNYTSGSQDPNWGSTNVSCSVAYTGGNTATASSLGTTVKARTHVATLTVRATGNGSKTKDGSVYVYQQANAVTSTSYETPVVTVPSNQSVASSAGDFYLTDENVTAKQDYSTTYTSGSRGSGTNNYRIYNVLVTSDNVDFGVAFDGDHQQYYRVYWGVNTGATRSATITATLTANGKSGSASFDITQSSPAPTTCSINIVNETPYSVYLAADGYEDDTHYSISIREDIPSDDEITVSFTAESVTIDYIAITSNAPTSGIFYCYDSDSGQFAECTYAGGTWGGDCEMPFYHADDTLYITYQYS